MVGNARIPYIRGMSLFVPFAILAFLLVLTMVLAFIIRCMNPRRDNEDGAYATAGPWLGGDNDW
jgi:phosphotransferase system  glucose/maltose/N-acetylglucosamine-specific IIC component